MPAQVLEDSFLFQFQLLCSTAEGNANLRGTAGPSLEAHRVVVRGRHFPAGSSLLQLLPKLKMLCLAKPRKGHMQDSRSEILAHLGNSWEI